MASRIQLTLVLPLALAIGFSTTGRTWAAGFDSPQAAFDAGKEALKKEDWKGFCKCLTDDSRDTLAGGLAMGGAMMQMFGGLGGDPPAELPKIGDVLKKHGLGDLSAKAMAMMQQQGQGDPSAMLKEVAKPIKDRDQFIADMMPLLKKMQKDKEGPIDPEAKLEDLKTEGDAASGMIVSTKNGEEKREPIEFKKESDGWKIVMPMPTGKGKGAAPGGLK